MRVKAGVTVATDYQHGFRKNRSCVSQLITTIQDLASGIDSSTQIDAILLDFSKAFDKVSHERLAAFAFISLFKDR
jgi:hypothetical protein